MSEVIREDRQTPERPVRTHHFISGLPRSGSTLLSAILRQNPKIHAGMTSPLCGLLNNLVSAVSTGTELGAMVSHAQRARLARGLFDSYYADLPEDCEAVFDTNRAWTAHLSTLVELFPDCKVLCCVRHVSWVMDSIERQFQASTLENTRLFPNAAERSTLFTRTETLAKPTGLVGFAWSALQAAVHGLHADRLLLIDYDLLVRQPADVIALVYEFLEMPPYQHDFDHVEYDAPEFDAYLGVEGLHKVHGKVAPRPRKSLLPPELFEKYENWNFSHTLKGSPARIIAARPA